MVTSLPGMTALVEAQRLTKTVGRDLTVFKCDQQFYRVALNFTWASPEKFGDIVLRLRGIH